LEGKVSLFRCSVLRCSGCEFTAKPSSLVWDQNKTGLADFEEGVDFVTNHEAHI
jgi:hypothetical protein